MNITTIRDKYSQYDDLSDKELIDALHTKYYIDIPIKEFYKKVGLSERDPFPTRSEPKVLNTKVSGLGSQLHACQDIISNALAILNESLPNILIFTKDKQIPYDETRQKLDQLESFTNIVVAVPEDYLHLQNPLLVKEGALTALEQLLSLQIEMTAKESALAEVLYLDALPIDSNIREAISTFREGEAWYRVFQSRWRKANNLHHSLQRNKQDISTKQKLIELEQIIHLQAIKENWKTSPTWFQFIGFPAPSAITPINGFVELARWNKNIKIASEDLQISIIDIFTFTADQARNLRREFIAIKTSITSATNSLMLIQNTFTKLDELQGMNSIANVIAKAQEFLDELNNILPWVDNNVISSAGFSDVLASYEAANTSKLLAHSINNNDSIKSFFKTHFAGVDTNCNDALEALKFGQSIDDLSLTSSIKEYLKRESPICAAKKINNSLNRIGDGLKSVNDFIDDISRFGDFDLLEWVGYQPDENLDNLCVFTESFIRHLEEAIANTDQLMVWSIYLLRRQEADEVGLKHFVSLLEEKKVRANELSDAYGYCIFSSITREAFKNIPQLGAFSGLKHNQIKEEFKRLDKEIISLRGKSIGNDCARLANPPRGKNGLKVDDKTEMVLINYLLPQQRPRMPVRKMLMKAGASIQALKPCFMMGPQAVAQYLTPGAIKFDLVIMDEASQLKPEEAIGAIARGGQLVVVGDPKQLPPTSYFNRISQPSDDEEQYATTDAESILDVCSSHFYPPRTLRWHYRSQHHSLIAFSNQHFYRGNLIIFPSPYGQRPGLGVRAVYMADAVYENQTNLREAKRVVDAVVEHINNRPNESLGIVTLNIKQRDLISELMDDRLSKLEGAENYIANWAIAGQRLFVKNLENVQGDERDAIIISTTFGKHPGTNVVRQNFGPISRQGGWRRLNVLFTRAKKSVTVYTSLKPEDIVNDSNTPEGTKALRNYLEYARTGLLTVAEPTNLDPDSDFEISVMNMLKLHGFEVTPQLGVAGYRIDIAVKHPDALGSYLAAIECDGATYHSALSVRDRDRIRQEILESLGWRGRIWRIWSTDWFRDPRQEANKLINFLQEVRMLSIPDPVNGITWIDEGVSNIEQQELASEEDRTTVDNTLIDSGDDVEVEVGDTVKYFDLRNTAVILTVNITAGKDDFANGIVNEAKPLAQILLGAVVGDEVALNFPGSQPKTFKIIEIIRKI